jgi:MFS family permease
LLWWGQAISSVGDFAWDTALVLCVATYLVAGQSWAPLAVSGLVLAAAVPQIAVGPIAGVFVDRWDTRKTMILMAALQAIFAVLLVLPAASFTLPLIGHVQLPLGWRLGAVYTDVALLASFAQFFIPAQFALIKDIVPLRLCCRPRGAAHDPGGRGADLAGLWGIAIAGLFLHYRQVEGAALPRACYVLWAGSPDGSVRKPIRRWVPSQNGLLADCPQGHRATRVSSRTDPSWRRICRRPCT